MQTRVTLMLKDTDQVVGELTMDQPPKVGTKLRLPATYHVVEVDQPSERESIAIVRKGAKPYMGPIVV